MKEEYKMSLGIEIIKRFDYLPEKDVPAAIKGICAEGFSVFKRDVFGRTATMLTRNPAVIRELKKLGADLEAVDYLGNPVLRHLKSNGYQEAYLEAYKLLQYE
ncbi:MAG: hypothetical protein J6Y03_03175 [Alphaproteobacteria bacterium]|nr:hypothetical protein [Alphaproteobacteria bacterium]